MDTRRTADRGQPRRPIRRRGTRIAASLLGGSTVDVSRNLAGLDREHLQPILAANTHASGCTNSGDGLNRTSTIPTTAEEERRSDPVGRSASIPGEVTSIVRGPPEGAPGKVRSTAYDVRDEDE